MLIVRCKSVTDSTVEVFLDESSVVDAIFMQSQEMKDTFQAFPELILLDATYKRPQTHTCTHTNNLVVAHSSLKTIAYHHDTIIDNYKIFYVILM